MARVRRKCLGCKTNYSVYRGGKHDTPWFYCPNCRKALGELTNHKPYIENAKVKEELL